MSFCEATIKGPFLVFARDMVSANVIVLRMKMMTRFSSVNASLDIKKPEVKGSFNF